MDIIHMNGRIYDPVIGRMLQSDPIIQAPEFILSYNRYSYVWNNPMNRIDPTGYESESDTDGENEAETNSNSTSEDDTPGLTENDDFVDEKDEKTGRQDASKEVDQDKNSQPDNDEKASKEKEKEDKGKSTGGRSGKANKGKSIDPDKNRSGLHKAANIASLVLAVLAFSPCSGVCGALSLGIQGLKAADHVANNENTDAAITGIGMFAGVASGKLASQVMSSTKADAVSLGASIFTDVVINQDNHNK